MRKKSQINKKKEKTVNAVNLQLQIKKVSILNIFFWVCLILMIVYIVDLKTLSLGESQKNNEKAIFGATFMFLVCFLFIFKYIILKETIKSIGNFNNLNKFFIIWELFIGDPIMSLFLIWLSFKKKGKEDGAKVIKRTR